MLYWLEIATNVNLKVSFFSSVWVFHELYALFFNFDKNTDKSAKKETNSLPDQGQPFTLYPVYLEFADGWVLITNYYEEYSVRSPSLFCASPVKDKSIRKESCMYFIILYNSYISKFFKIFNNLIKINFKKIAFQK